MECNITDFQLSNKNEDLAAQLEVKQAEYARNEKKFIILKSDSLVVFGNPGATLTTMSLLKIPAAETCSRAESPGMKTMARFLPPPNRDLSDTNSIL